MRVLAATIASTLMLAAPGASGQTPPGVPIYVVVEGSGRVRVRLAAGSVRPCDSSDNQQLFNGEIPSGQAIALTSPTNTVCVEHTFGRFRSGGWSTAATVGPRCVKWGRHRCLHREKFIRIDLSTDHAFTP